MDATPDLDLSIIIVSWNVRELLEACLRSLASSPGVLLIPRVNNLHSGPAIGTEVIVIDNASADGTATMLAEHYPWVRLIANQDNRGFTRGNNQGLALSRGRYVFFLNPDTEVQDDAIAAMYSYMQAHPDTGALGPQLRYGDGSPQSSRRRFPTLATALFESSPLAWHLPAAGNPWARRYRMEDRPSLAAGEPEPVDWVVGAALWTRRAVLNQIGGFDEGYFMYSEELDWCRRAAAAGWQTVYLPKACIVHHEGKSSEQVVAARHIRFQTSKVRYFRKFHGPLAAGTLRYMLLALFGLEWALEAAKWLAGSRRPLRRSRMAAYGQLLHSGLSSGA